MDSFPQNLKICINLYVCMQLCHRNVAIWGEIIHFLLFLLFSELHTVIWMSHHLRTNTRVVIDQGNTWKWLNLYHMFGVGHWVVLYWNPDFKLWKRQKNASFILLATSPWQHWFESLEVWPQFWWSLYRLSNKTPFASSVISHYGSVNPTGKRQFRCRQ